MAVLSIILSIAICTIFYVYIKHLYIKLKEETFGFFFNEIANNHNILHGSVPITINFGHITMNFILKEIIFILVNIVVIFSDSLTISYFYVLLLVYAWRIFFWRKEDISISIKDLQPYLLKAYISIPIFQTILYFCTFITYLLNG